MERTINSTQQGPKVSQIATFFQRRPVETTEDSSHEQQPSNSGDHKETTSPVAVVRTESHATRFNNARALFEKLGVENRSIRPSALKVKMAYSGSQEDNLDSSNSSRSDDRSPSPNKIPKSTPTTTVNNITNGMSKVDPMRIYNMSRLKSEKPDKPEKPERKFNSKELIEKQKNWTSHFTKARPTTPRITSDPNRCDIIRTGPPSMSSDLNKETRIFTPKLSGDNQHTDVVKKPQIPDVRPRIIRNVPTGAPTSAPPPIPLNKPQIISPPPRKPLESISTNVHIPDQPNEIIPDKKKKRSIDYVEEQPIDEPAVNDDDDKPPMVTKRTSSLDNKDNSLLSSVNTFTSSTSSALSASLEDQLSPIHTEDEKQENESPEKSTTNIQQLNHGGAKDHSSDIHEPVSVSKRANLPANIPTDIIYGSSEPSMASSTDEGGFNEPSPEIKAKLKPCYTYDAVGAVTHLSGFQRTDEQLKESEDREVQYIDMGYRLNPDGSENAQPFNETNGQDKITVSKIETALTASKLNARINGFDDAKKNLSDGTVYATIKPEIPPPTAELFDENEVIRKSDKVDPQRPSLLVGSEATDDIPLKPSCKPPPLPTSPPTTDSISSSAKQNESSDEDVPFPDAMTADEADRLLSSRQQSLLSDEQAREVEQLLLKQNKETENIVQSENADDTSEPDWLQEVLQASKEPSPVAEVKRPINANVTEDTKEISNQASDQNKLSGLNNDSSMNESQDIFNESIYPSMISTDVTTETENSSLNTTVPNEYDRGSDRQGLSGISHLEQTGDSINNGSMPESNQDDEYEQYYIPQYPPVKAKEIYCDADGVHYFEDGNFWIEYPPLTDGDEDDTDLTIPVKKNNKLKFDTGPVVVFSTYSVDEYDRRNDEVDPVAASAEYELEKRVEKMHIFPVNLMKGPEGLGLSIIGMGVGADAGLEKLGIFVKTITDNGAAAKDGNIQVNDQIIEVDDKSLVGVTQAYAAAVLRNTSGLVRFKIGRERDPTNSEVAQLIRQSLQADKEKEERLRRQQEEFMRRSMDNSEDSTQPVSASSSISECPPSPFTHDKNQMDVDSVHSQEVESLKRILQENQIQIVQKSIEIRELKDQLAKLEASNNESEHLKERLKECEKQINDLKKEANNYQNILQLSQSQFVVLEKKYNRAKKLIREFQQREVDMMHREEFYMQLVQEKDTEYNSLVKKLKDRIIHLEQELQETQKKAGLPVYLPFDSSSLKLTPQMSRRQPPKPLFKKLDATDISDTEISDLSPDGEENEKTSTVERKLPLKDELDTVIPQHELLDTSANKTKCELASKGGLSNRQLPGKRSLSNSSSECALDDGGDEDNIMYVRSLRNGNGNGINGQHTTNGLQKEEERKTNVYTASMNISPPLYAQVHKEKSNHENNGNQQRNYRNNAIDSDASSMQIDLNSSYDSIVGSSSKLSESGRSDIYSNCDARNRGVRMPHAFTTQLNQVLADREHRKNSGASEIYSRSESTDEYLEIQGRTTPLQQNPAAVMTQNLVVEIRQAVNEAQPKVKNVLPQSLSPPGTVPWQQQQQQQQPQQQQQSHLFKNCGPPSPSSMSSGSTSPGYSPTRNVDLSGSSTSFSSERRAPHQWQNGPVPEWSKDQVCQWLMALGLEQHIPKFLEHGVEGCALLELDSRDFKILGVTGDDKQKLKRKLKELKHLIEKEKRQQEKDRKEREKMIKKAEKKAEKANKKK